MVRPGAPRHRGGAPDPDGGGTAQDRWVRPALVALLALTAVAYLWDLSASGYANSFYAAAVQAGTKSWKAFFFGSLDSSNFITVDKSPGSLWVMELSGRLFGFNSWSMLVPQVLEGVAAVGLVYAAVKRWFGPAAGLLAGGVLACTPVAALMFRFNNPDALMVLLLVAAAYTLTRALERAGTGWIIATGTLIGLAFLAKMLQAFTVVPAFAAVYLVASPAPLRRRLWQLALGGVAIVVVGRLVGGRGGPVAGGVATAHRRLTRQQHHQPDLRVQRAQSPFGWHRGGGSGFSGPTGVFRLFNDLMGGQASWLLPASLVALVAGLVWRGRAPRTDRTRAALLLWGGWLIVTGAVFSFSRGVIHTYYTVALAPAIAALVGIGGALLWQNRHQMVARVIGAAAIVATAAWAFVLLGRTPAYDPWLRPVVLALGILSAAALVSAPAVPRLTRHLTGLAIGLALVAGLAGPLAYTVTTLDTAHTGSIPSAGPVVTAEVAPGPASAPPAERLALPAGPGGPGGGSGPGAQGGGFPGGGGAGPAGLSGAPSGGAPPAGLPSRGNRLAQPTGPRTGGAPIGGEGGAGPAPPSRPPSGPTPPASDG